MVVPKKNDKDCVMPDHYYTPLPQSDHKPARVEHSYRGHRLAFDTDSGVFSRLEIDKGTELLLNALPDGLEGTLLDMGCGYGALGCALGKAYPQCRVTMADVNQRAVDLAAGNARQNGVVAETLQSDGYELLAGRRFDWIVQNPPIRAGKQVIYAMFADGAKALPPEGQLWLVIRKQQGAPSAMTYLRTLFGQVEAVEKKAGYWILRCASPHGATKAGE